jgi:hypothetical protein
MSACHAGRLVIIRLPSVPVGSANVSRIAIGSWEHLVRIPFRSGRSLALAPLPTEMISPHSKVKQTPSVTRITDLRIKDFT